MSLLTATTALWLAAGPDTVLLLGSNDPAWRTLETRVAAELYAAGFEVKVEASTVSAAGDIPGQLWLACQQDEALAVLWFSPRDDGRVDTWIADRVTGKALVRTWDAPATPSARATLALKAVELLHASLLEVRLLEPKQREQVPEVAREAVRTVLKPKPRAAWEFGTGIGVMITPGGLRPQPMLELQLGYTFKLPISLELQLATSVWPVHLDETLGSADVGLAFARLFALWTPLRWRDFFGGLVGGTGALLLWASGSTNADGLEAKADARLGWLLSGGLSLGMELIESVRLRLLATVGTTIPPMGVRIAGTSYAAVGQLPIYDAVLRLEFE